jgi:hypothetical protein
VLGVRGQHLFDSKKMLFVGKGILPVIVAFFARSSSFHFLTKNNKNGLKMP